MGIESIFEPLLQPSREPVTIYNGYSINADKSEVRGLRQDKGEQISPEFETQDSDPFHQMTSFLQYGMSTEERERIRINRLVQPEQQQQNANIYEGVKSVLGFKKNSEGNGAAESENVNFLGAILGTWGKSGGEWA